MHGKTVHEQFVEMKICEIKNCMEKNHKKRIETEAESDRNQW